MILITTKMLQLSSFPNALFGADKQGEFVCTRFHKLWNFGTDCIESYINSVPRQ